MLYIFNRGFFQDSLYPVNVLEKDVAPNVIKAGSGHFDFYLGDHPPGSGSHDQHSVSQEDSFLDQMCDYCGKMGVRVELQWH